MGLYICKKIKGSTLKIEAGINTQECPKTRVLPSSYSTKNNGLYILDLRTIMLILKEYSSEHGILGLSSSYNWIMRPRAFLNVRLLSISMFRNYVSNIRMFDLGCITDAIANVLYHVAENFRDIRLSEFENAVLNLSSFKMKYDPKHVILKPYKIDKNKINNIVRKNIVNHSHFEKTIEFIEQKAIDSLIPLFSYIIPFTIDEMKKLSQQYDEIKINDKEGSPFTWSPYLSFNIFGNSLIGNGILWWENNFEMPKESSTRYIEFIEKDRVVFKSELHDFIDKFFIERIKHHIQQLGDLELHILNYIAAHGVAFFVMNYVKYFFDWEQIIGPYQSRSFLELDLKKEKETLQISDSKYSFEFKQYNKDFFKTVFNSLPVESLVLFYLKNGIVEWQIVDEQSFFNNKLKLNAGEKFLFVLQIKSKKPKKAKVLVYVDIENILKALSFLTGEHEDKSFLYEVAVAFFERYLQIAY